MRPVSLPPIFTAKWALFPHLVLSMIQRAGKGELELQSANDISNLVRNWIEAKLAHTNTDLKVAAQGNLQQRNSRLPPPRLIFVPARPRHRRAPARWRRCDKDAARPTGTSGVLLILGLEAPACLRDSLAPAVATLRSGLDGRAPRRTRAAGSGALPWPIRAPHTRHAAGSP